MSEDPPRRHSVADLEVSGLRGRLLVRLDGVEVGKVRAYDCDAGTVTKMVTDAEGRPLRNAERTNVLEETLSGTVTVEWKDPPAMTLGHSISTRPRVEP